METRPISPGPRCLRQIDTSLGFVICHIPSTTFQLGKLRNGYGKSFLRCWKMSGYLASIYCKKVKLISMSCYFFNLSFHYTL